MNPDEDREFLYLARQALITQLDPPAPWQAVVTHDHEIYYWNEATGERTQTNPMDKEYRAQFLQAKQQRLQA